MNCAIVAAKQYATRPTPPPFFSLSCYHRIIYYYALHLSGNVRETISGLIQDNTLDAGNSNLHRTSRYQSVNYLFRDKAQFTWRQLPIIPRALTFVDCSKIVWSTPVLIIIIIIIIYPLQGTRKSTNDLINISRGKIRAFKC